MLIKRVTKPRVVTKLVIVKVDVIHVSIKMKRVSHKTARQEPHSVFAKHNKIAADGSLRNVGKKKKKKLTN